MAVWITPRPKDDVLPPRTKRLAPRRSSILFRLLNINPFPLFMGSLLAAIIGVSIISTLQQRNVAKALREQLSVVTKERDKFQQDIESLSSGRRTLIVERDDWRSKAEAAEKQIVALERERDQLRKRLVFDRRDGTDVQPSPSP